MTDQTLVIVSSSGGDLLWDFIFFEVYHIRHYYMAEINAAR